MRCPFLREAQVKFCGGSAYKKMILQTAEHGGEEKCSSPDFVHCAALKQHLQEIPIQDRCPFLQESLVQYCSAASMTKYIPYSESLLSRCGTDGHTYCEIYLAIAAPEDVRPAKPSGEDAGNETKEVFMEHTVEGIKMPGALAYTANHMWLDVGEDGSCHVGVDAFLTQVLGSVDKITFLSSKGVNKPTAVLNVQGVDLQMVFPYLMPLRGANNYLRANPGKLVSHPYTLGWLFEGTQPKVSSAEKEVTGHEGLMRGAEADEWMKGEVKRLSEYVHTQVYSSRPGNERIMMDGGLLSGGLLQHLNREERLILLNEFFSPYASWRRWW